MDTGTLRATAGNWMMICMAAAALAACGGGDDGGSPTSAGSTSTSAAPTSSSGSTSETSDSAQAPESETAPSYQFTDTAYSETTPTLGSHSPSISGTPLSSLNAGSAYSFTPTASDPDGDELHFNIQNKPAWASFNIATGQLTGTPTAADVATYSNILIGVSDGLSSATLPSFSIAVVQASDGQVTVNWLPPTENADGTSLTDLSGYKIVYGTNATSLSQTIELTNAGLTAYVIENLSPGTWYFAVRAVNSSGLESIDSNVASKMIS